MGLEPTTPGLRVPCSTDWANRARCFYRAVPKKKGTTIYYCFGAALTSEYPALFEKYNSQIQQIFTNIAQKYQSTLWCFRKSIRRFLSGDLAQMVERSLSMWEVLGSMPRFSSNFYIFVKNLWRRKYFSQDKIFDLARIRTWNLLIRSQTRYPLRHKTPRKKNEDQTSFFIK